MSAPLCCPRCRGALEPRVEELRCRSCGGGYPVVAGVPDLRTAPDPWIAPEEDRAKGLAVLERGGPTFESLVRAYWELTPGTEPERAERHLGHVLGAVARTREWLTTVADPAGAGERWLDLGCGTADLACASPDGVEVTGLDVAFRWLVIAGRRLEEHGRAAELVCGNAETLPFPDGSFHRVVALGTLEHCRDPAAALREARRVLRPGGVFLARSPNRYSLLPEPHVGVWGVGWLPRRWADRYVRWRTGRGYLHHRPLGPAEWRMLLRRAGLEAVEVRAGAPLAAERVRLPRVLRGLLPAYAALRGLPGARAALRAVAPMLDVRARAA